MIMDDIEQGKIGKKEEKLVGWDHIRKPKIGTNYPPMRARDPSQTPNTNQVYKDTQTKKSSSSEDYFEIAFILSLVVVLVVLVIIASKIYGFW
jgi:hypothetical protein